MNNYNEDKDSKMNTSVLYQHTMSSDIDENEVKIMAIYTGKMPQQVEKTLRQNILWQIEEYEDDDIWCNKIEEWLMKETKSGCLIDGTIDLTSLDNSLTIIEIEHLVESFDTLVKSYQEDTHPKGDCRSPESRGCYWHIVTFVIKKNISINQDDTTSQDGEESEKN